MQESIHALLEALQARDMEKIKEILSNDKEHQEPFLYLNSRVTLYLSPLILNGV
jgi:hypothetical protein